MKAGGRMTLTVLVLALCLVGTGAGAADLEVIYVEGQLQLRTSGGWAELEIGDVVPDDATVQFDGEGVAELVGQAVQVTLRKQGVFQLSDIVARSQNVASTGLGGLVKGRVAGVLQGTKKSESAVMGVRASEAATEKESISWLGSTDDLVKQGKGELEKEAYDEALELFEEAYDYADLDEEGPILFYVGYSNAMLGRNGPALAALEQAEVDETHELYGSLLILRGQLLVEALAFNEALSDFDAYRNRLSGGGSIQLAQLLAGYCEKELGDSAGARKSLEAAYSADPASDLAATAESLLGQL